jgi:hypothetical protein
MAVQESTPIQFYTASGASGLFAFSFQVLDADDLVALVDGAAASFSVSGVGNPAGGSATITPTPTAGQSVVLYRDSAISRETDYQSNGDLLAAVVNRDFDRIWLVLQELVLGTKASAASVRAPAGEELAELPDADTRATKLLAFDANGDPEPTNFTVTQVASAVAAAYAAGSTADAVTYIQDGTGAEARSVQSWLRGMVWVDDFAGDGVDDTLRIQQAVNYAGANRLGRVHFAARDYITSATINVTYMDVTLVGAGGAGNHTSTPTVGATRILGSHTSGAVIRLSNLGNGIKDMFIGSTGARASLSEPLGTCYGLHIEAEDLNNRGTRRFRIDSIRVTAQPASGVVIIGDCLQSTAIDLDVDNCGGHGIVINDGTFTGRTWLQRPGQMIFINPRTSRTGGHGIRCGNLTNINRPYRIMIDNYESFYNVMNESVREVDYNWILHGENITLTNCAVGGEISPGNSVNGGIYIAAQQVRILNQRFVDTKDHIAHVTTYSAFPSRDVEIHIGFIDNANEPPGYYDPAVLVDTDAQNVKVICHSRSSDIGSLMSTSSLNFESERINEKRFSGYQVSGAFQSVAAQMVLVDDALGYWQFDGLIRGVAQIAATGSAGGSAKVHFRAGDSVAFCTLVDSSGPTFDVASVASAASITAPYGTDGRLTLVVSQDEGRLYISNRTGFTASYNITLMSAEGYATGLTVL